MAHAAGEPRPVHEAPPIEWVVRVPGSKSLTNRALVLAAMAGGETALELALRSDDTDALCRALASLGAGIEEVAASPEPSGSHGGFRVRGVGGAFPPGPDLTVNLGDGGTPTRFMMPVAAFAPRRVTIDGSARMRERPVADGMAMLRSLGVDAAWAGSEGQLPIIVDGHKGPPRGGALRVGELASSQFVSALLLVAPWMRDGLELRLDAPPVSRSYIDLTIEELRRWGAVVDEDCSGTGALRAVRVAPGPIAARGVVLIEPDASSALYWAAAAAIVPGSDVTLHGVSTRSRQPDAAAIALLGAHGAERAGGDGDERIACRCAPGDRSPPLDGFNVDLGHCPDGALMLIAAAAVASGPSRFSGLGTLRVKESDRLAAMAEGLHRVGAGARVGDSWIEVEPIPAGHRVQATIDPHGDHRIAMSFAVLGLRTGGIAIERPDCVTKSYPAFWRALRRCEEGGQ